MYEEALREKLGIPADWRYISTPFILKTYWDQWLNIMGPENIHLVSGSVMQQTINDEPQYFYRASFFASPLAVERVNEQA